MVNVNLFQTVTFLCPTNLININRVEAPNPNTESYYNLYVREISSSERNLDYNTICDTTSEYDGCDDGCDGDGDDYDGSCGSDGSDGCDGGMMIVVVMIVVVVIMMVQW